MSPYLGPGVAKATTSHLYHFMPPVMHSSDVMPWLFIELLLFESKVVSSVLSVTSPGVKRNG